MMLSMVLFANVIVQALTLPRESQRSYRKTQIFSNPPQPVETVKDGSIVFDHVEFSYASKADKPVLTDICLNIPSGPDRWHHRRHRF